MTFLRKRKIFIAVMLVVGLCFGTNLARGENGTQKVYDFVTLQDLEQPNAALCRLVIEEAFRRNGLETTFQTFPNKRVLELVETGEADGDLLRVADITRNNYLRIDEPIYSASFVAYAVREDISVQTWEDLKTNNYRIGYFAGAVKPVTMIEKKLQIDESRRVRISTEIPSGFKMLLEDRFDILILGYFPAVVTLRKEDFLSAGVRFAGTVEEFNVHAFLNAKYEDLAPVIAETIREMKRDGTFDRLKEAAGFNF